MCINDFFKEQLSSLNSDLTELKYVKHKQFTTKSRK